MLIGVDASRANIANKTGVEWYSYNLINVIKKIDQNNQYILYSQDELKDELGNLPDNFKSKVLLWKFSKLWTQLRLFWQANLDRNKILFIPAGVIPIIPIKLYKTITTIHDVCFLDFPEYYSKRELMMQKIGLKLAILFAKKIITVSNFTKEKIIKYTKCNPNKLSVVHLGYDKKKYKIIDDIELKNKVRKKYDLPEKFILFIGRIEEKKNIINQVKAFQKLREKYKDYYFVLIGKRGYKYDEINEELFKNDLHRNVIELGWVDDSDISIIINMANVFMYVTGYEGFGLPILEAQACSIPVITSQDSAQPEIAGEAALYSSPSNILGIYENLIKVIENRDNIKEELIKKGLINIEKFSWEKCARETIKKMTDDK
jgi:glycosyltransferase involved in cell wall biosynthesis